VKKLLLFCVMMTVLTLSSAANAATVGMYGDYGPGILPAPHTGDSLTLNDIETGVLNSYDVFWIGHAAYDSPAQWTQLACDQVESFLANGGGVVTEWNGLTMLFESVDAGSYFPMLGPQCGLFTGSMGAGDNVGSDTPINVLNPGSPLMAGLSNPFSMGGGSQFFYTTGIDMNQWTVDADYTGHGGTWPAVMYSALAGGMVVVGTMDYADVLPENATAATLLGNMIDLAVTGAVDQPAQAGFRVTKTFSDGLIADVEVSISCNDGFVSTDTATISSDGGSHRFVVTDFLEGSMDCEITEAGTDGYMSDSCTFTDVNSGEYTCDLFNDAEDGTFSVTKTWDILGQDVDAIDQDVVLVIDCESDISNPMPLPCDIDTPDSTQCVWTLDWDGLGLGDSVTASVDVDTSDGDAYCTAYETGIDASEVESSDDCDPRMLVEAAGSNGCTITNTVFFEGIPTLSQYGLALMALLMLGVGMIGFRRFA
jgi:hypothetical protein